MKYLILCLCLVTSIAVAGKWSKCSNEELLGWCYLFPSIKGKEHLIVPSQDGRTFHFTYAYQIKEQVKVYKKIEGEKITDVIDRIRNEHQHFTSFNKYPIIEEVETFIGSFESQTCPK